jgi:hypothetical protein
LIGLWPRKNKTNFKALNDFVAKKPIERNTAGHWGVNYFDQKLEETNADASLGRRSRGGEF